MNGPVYKWDHMTQMLRLARMHAGWSLSEASARIGISRATISRAERADHDSPVGAETLLILCDFYDLNPREAVFHGNTPLKRIENIQHSFTDARPDRATAGQPCGDAAEGAGHG